MNIEKLKEYEAEFLEQYPNGFDDRSFPSIMKTFNPIKLEEFTKDALKKENFQNSSLLVDGFFKVVQKSVFVSVFDKLKLKDMIANLNSYEKDMLSIEIYELLYGNKKDGFEGLVEFLSEYKLAKWTIISVFPYCINRHQDYFIKPTTTKNIIKTFELEDYIYKAKPSFEFYDKYTKALDKMK
jgi:CRISPR/Cas system-associated endoribonuclease Cas2